MNVSYVKTNNLQQKTMDNEPIKQTQSKPIYGEPVEPTKPISWTSAGQVFLFRPAMADKYIVQGILDGFDSFKLKGAKAEEGDDLHSAPLLFEPEYPCVSNSAIEAFPIPKMLML